MTDLQVMQPAALFATLFRFFLSRFVPLSTIFSCEIQGVDCKNFKSTLTMEIYYTQMKRPERRDTRWPAVLGALGQNHKVVLGNDEDTASITGEMGPTLVGTPRENQIFSAGNYESKR